MLFLMTGVWAYSQKIDNISFQMDGDKVKIFYTLTGDYAEQTFEVKIYTSVDNFEKPLEQLDGDANKKNILPGKKEVKWDAKKEYKLFEGNISFKIVANVVSNFWISSPTKGDVLKRGQDIEIAWEGFRPTANLKISVVYPGGKSADVATYVTGKTYRWKVKGPVGKGAYIKVSEMDNQKNFAKSGAFVIKRKIPLAAQGGIVAVGAGAVLYYLLKPVEVPPLPLPPDPSK